MDLQPDADGIERALHELVELAVALGRGRGIANHQRLSIGQRTEAVAAFAITEFVEQRIRELRRVRDDRAVLRVVTCDTRRHGELRADRLPLANNADLIVDVVGHCDRAAQGDLLRAETAYGIRLVAYSFAHVEVGVGDLRVHAALKADAAFRELRPQASVVCKKSRRHLPELILHVRLTTEEGEPAALGLFHDADFHAFDLRQCLACHARRNVARNRVVSRCVVPDLSAVAGICFEDDLR